MRWLAIMIPELRIKVRGIHREPISVLSTNNELAATSNNSERSATPLVEITGTISGAD